MYAPARNRPAAAIASALLIGGAALVLVEALSAVPVADAARSAMEAVFTPQPDPSPTPSPTPTPTPTPTPAPRPDQPAPKQPAAPAAPAAAQVVAPPPPVRLRPPLPIPVATAQPGQGSATAGAGTGRTGNGTGAGGAGNGTGGGGAGGEGYGSGKAVPAQFPRQVAGKLRFSDLPSQLRRSREGDTLTLRYRIGTDGSVSQCSIIASSGDPALDAHTCALITERFRFRPARDDSGQPVAFWMVETHGWGN